MKLYDAPKMEMIVFSTEDVLTDASNVINTPIVPVKQTVVEEPQSETIHPTR